MLPRPFPARLPFAAQSAHPGDWGRPEGLGRGRGGALPAGQPAARRRLLPKPPAKPLARIPRRKRRRSRPSRPPPTSTTWLRSARWGSCASRSFWPPGTTVCGLLTSMWHTSGFFLKKFCATARWRKVQRQRLLMPLLVELKPWQMVVFARIAEELERNGFEVEPFGPQTLAVKAAPVGLEGDGSGADAGRGDRAVQRGFRGTQAESGSYGASHTHCRFHRLSLGHQGQYPS